MPANVRKAINLPHLDEGIDLIARDRHGKYWAFQAKYRAQQDQPLSRRALGTFHSQCLTGLAPISIAAKNWRSFEEARAFVRTLGLKDAKEWFPYCRSGKRPIEIPTTPYTVYADAGWVNFPDWLGYNDDWRPFKEARAFARKLGFKSSAKYAAYCRSGKNQMTSRKVLARSMLTLAGPAGVIGLEMDRLGVLSRARFRKRGHSCESLS